MALFALFNVVLESYWYIYAIFHAGKSSFSWHIRDFLCDLCKDLCIVINFVVLWSICLSFSIVHFKNGPEYLTRESAQMIIPLMKFLLQSLVSRSFLVLLRYSFPIFFLHFILFVGVCFQYSQGLEIFLLSLCCHAFLIWSFYSFCCFSFPIFHYEHGTFFNAKCHSYILTVYSYCMYQGCSCFSFLVINIIR